MRRMTRRIGLFGGPAAMMSAAGVKKPGLKARETTEGQPAGETAVPAQTAATAASASPVAPSKKGWLSRLFGSEKE